MCQLFTKWRWERINKISRNTSVNYRLHLKKLQAFFPFGYTKTRQEGTGELVFREFLVLNSLTYQKCSFFFCERLL